MPWLGTGVAASFRVLASMGWLRGRELGSGASWMSGHALACGSAADGTLFSNGTSVEYLVVDRLLEAGLGQDYDSMTLARTTEAWIAAGEELRARVARIIDDITADVEVIGSSSVVGLLAKPIIDLAVGLQADQPLAPVAKGLEADGWIYRGDAGAAGGHVFVLEARPRLRVSHLHVIRYDGDAWRNYLRLRDLLRRDPEARQRYEAVKVELAERKPVDRKAYTDGKTDVVASLLRRVD